MNVKTQILFFVIIIIIILFYVPSFFQMQDLKKTNDDYKAQIERLTLKNARLKEEYRRLEEDPEYLEKVARDKMHLMREGEVMYKIEGNND